MKGAKPKTLSQVNDCPQRDRTESEMYVGVQTFIWMTEDNIVEVPFDNLDNYDNYSLNLRLIKK